MLHKSGTIERSTILTSCIIAGAVASTFIFQVANAASAISHYVWNDSGTYQPFSRTSISITGPLKLTAKDGSVSLHLDDKGPFKLSSQSMSYREWGTDLSGDKVTAEVFKIDQDPGQLLNGNKLCSGTARYFVFHESRSFGENLLNLAVFNSDQPPFDIKSEGLCGTFSYSIERPKISKPMQSAQPRNKISGVYDIASYCKKVGQAAGGSYQIEQTCRDEERQAQKDISNMTYPADIENYCEKVGRAAGGSYSIMNVCIKEELSAKANLN